MKADAKQLTEKLQAILGKFQTAYADIERQINEEFAARDARLADLEDRIKALEGNR